MEAMTDLKKLLMHEVTDLMSAEDQIIKAMPLMIKKAKNPELIKALQEHLKVTEKQRARLNKVQSFFKKAGEEPQQPGKNGFLSGLFGGGQKCLGMDGLITEGQKVMNEDMTQKVLDAAIIACAQKIEHYEICGYGTARAYSRELQMPEVTRLLEETLKEEYFADDTLTKLAVMGGINEEAELGDMKEGETTLVKVGKSSTKSNSFKKAATPKKAAVKKAATKKAAANKGKK